MNMCKKSDVTSHPIAFSDHVIQTVTISTAVDGLSDCQPYGYYKDGARDINSGWRVTGVNSHSAYWARVITTYELEEWESGD